MGFFQRILAAFGLLKKEAKVLVVGLDNSGKTTLLNNLKLRRAALHEVAPTVGFQVESFELGEIKFTAMDMSGAGTYRSLWETYYADAQAIIFVVDAADKIRMVVARDELEALLAHPDIKNAKAKVTGDGGGAGYSSASSSSAAAGSAANGIPILFFANKLDTPSALAAADVSVVMGLPAIRDRAWQIQGCVALTGEHVEEGLMWLVQQLNKSNSNNDKGNKNKSTSGGGSSKATSLGATTAGGKTVGAGSK